MLCRVNPAGTIARARNASSSRKCPVLDGAARPAAGTMRDTGSLRMKAGRDVRNPLNAGISISTLGSGTGALWSRDQRAAVMKLYDDVNFVFTRL